MNNFEPEDINIQDLNLPNLPEGNIDFYEVEFNPVIDVMDGKTGPVALFGKIRTFPLESLLSYNARQLTREEFFKMFPETKAYFSKKEQQAA